jgi:RNA polymerase sigma-70 factor (ECF subfamily)
MAADYSLALPAPARPDDEAVLVSRARAGDHAAYAALVRRYEQVAYRVAASVAGSADDGQEAVQNAYVKAHRSLGSFRPGSPFRPWLLRIVVNEAHNVRRSERRHVRLGARAGEQAVAPAAGVDEAFAAREEVGVVLAGLARLGDADRLAIALRYFADLPDREAAELAGVSPEAFRVRVLRALRRLRALLQEGE